MDSDRIRPRRGPVRVRDGIPYADPSTTLSLMPAAAIGEWLARHREAFTGVLLDLGCGNAPYKSWYNEFVDRTVTYDPAPSSDVNVRGVGELLPFRDESFDCVLATEMLEHTTDCERTVAEAFRVLKQGGTLIATAPFIYPLHEAPHDYRRFTYLGLQDLLLRHGFEIDAVGARGGLGVLTGHWALMVAVEGMTRIWPKVGGHGQVTDQPWFQNTMAAIQAPVIRRGVCRPAEGSARWASLGYMVRAHRAPLATV